MPTYEYRCPPCGHEFERFQSITADPVAACPACGSGEVKRLIGTGAGIIFKGSGFYQTDYRSKSYKQAEKADNKAAEPKPAETCGGGTCGKPECGGAEASAA